MSTRHHTNSKRAARAYMKANPGVPYLQALAAVRTQTNTDARPRITPAQVRNALANLFEVEIRYQATLACDPGFARMVLVATPSTTMDSWIQAPDDIRAEWLAGSATDEIDSALLTAVEEMLTTFVRQMPHEDAEDIIDRLRASTEPIDAQCARCGGSWGADQTCGWCSNDTGQPAPVLASRTVDPTAYLTRLAETLGIDPADLDDDVHDACDARATERNNAGDFDILCMTCGEPMGFDENEIAHHLSSDRLDEIDADADADADHVAVAEDTVETFDRAHQDESRTGSDVNNGGLPAQISFLTDVLGADAVQDRLQEIAARG
jgi:hypothetical protein